jgi:hypothetical protein
MHGYALQAFGEVTGAPEGDCIFTRDAAICPLVPEPIIAIGRILCNNDQDLD